MIAATACKRWRVGDRAFYYEPVMEDIKEVEVVGARYDYHVPVVHIRTCSGQEDYFVRQEELTEENS